MRPKGGAPAAATAAGLGVVVVSYNTRALLDACLSSLSAEIGLGAWDADVLVVDNASSDESAAMVRLHHPWVRLEASRRNLGYAAAANLGLRPWLEDGGPEWLLVLNPDTELLPGTLEALRDALLRQSGAAIVGPGLVYPDGRFQHPAFRFPGVAQTLLDLAPVARLADSRLNGRYPRRLYESGTPFAVDFPLGACLFARAKAVRQFGVLDEGYFMYCEEIDWCRRARDAGFAVLCAPRATVVHHAAASTRQVRAPMFAALWRSRLRLFDRFEPSWRSRLLRGLVRVGLAARGLADQLAARLGRLDPKERDQRREAYRLVFAAGGPPLVPGSPTRPLADSAETPTRKTPS